MEKIMDELRTLYCDALALAEAAVGAPNEKAYWEALHEVWDCMNKVYELGNPDEAY